MSHAQTTLFFWPTPNCYKVSILLEELELEYAVRPVQIGKGKQFDRTFLEISPHGKIPALKEQNANGNIQYAINRYTNEALKIYSVLDAQLGRSQYIAGDDYSIADIAIYPWLRPQKMQGQNISNHPNLQRWYNTLRARPAIKRGLLVMNKKVSKSGKKPVGDAWKTLFDHQSK
jgi:glutathione S-transferase